MSTLGNKQTYRELLRALSENLAYLHDIYYGDDSLDGLPALPKYHDDLFRAVAAIGDRSLSEAVLRMVLRAQFEIFDKNTLESVNKYYIGEKQGEPVPFRDSYSWPYCEALDFCWDLAESLVSVLERYGKSYGIPAFSAWQMAIPHEGFSEFVGSLYDVTRGFLSQEFFSDRLLEAIAYTSRYEELVLPMTYLDKMYGWVAAKFPRGLCDNQDRLFEFCAQLVKYQIYLPGEPMFECPSGALDILMWRPNISLPCLCRSYLDGLPGSYCDWDGFWLAIEAATEGLPGGISEQLLGVFYTNNDPEVRRGAVELAMLDLSEMEASDFISLVKHISEIKLLQERIDYAGLLPSTEEVRKQYQDESLVTKYEEYLKTIKA
jgi:hypothetical protein